MPGLNTGRALIWPDQARFHVLKHLDGLARAIERLGGRIHGDTAMIGVSEDEGGTVTTMEDQTQIRAPHAVMPANVALGDLPIQVKL